MRRGSCFVQIGDENVHRVGVVMDDIFGAENRLATISYATSGGHFRRSTLPKVADYLLWYAKDKRHGEVPAAVRAADPSRDR